MIPFLSDIGENKVSVDIKTNGFHELSIFKEPRIDGFFKDKPNVLSHRKVARHSVLQEIVPKAIVETEVVSDPPCVPVQKSCVEDELMYRFAMCEDKMLSLFQSTEIDKKVDSWRVKLAMEVSSLYPKLRKMTRQWTMEDYAKALGKDRSDLEALLVFMAVYFKKNIVKDNLYIRYKHETTQDFLLIGADDIEERSGYDSYLTDLYRGKNLNLNKTLVKDLKEIADVLGISTKGMLKADLIKEIDKFLALNK